MKVATVTHMPDPNGILYTILFPGGKKLKFLWGHRVASEDFMATRWIAVDKHCKWNDVTDKAILESLDRIQSRLINAIHYGEQIEIEWNH